MPDTLHIPLENGDTLLIQQAEGADSAQITTIPGTIQHPNNGTGGSLAWPGLFVIVLILGALAAIVLWRFLLKRYQVRKAKRLYDDKHAVYDRVIQQYIPYYQRLDAAQKDRFLKRTLIFMASKKFEFVEMEEEEHMSLLISAAAIQLTFGLQHYLMDHFNTIYILKNDYHFGLLNVPFQGHVSDDGIYLSWNNFLRGNANDHDGDNVGLHEMAHALAYVNFTAHNGEDEEFKRRFWRFSRVGMPIFDRLQAGEITLLGTYAATNREEFWAVCVENFFERPSSFKIQLPELYDAMCSLLNQDMLKSGIILTPVEEEL